jgi:serine protease Do
MDFQQIIDQYQYAIIQIATPTATGTGFYLKDYDMIVTNEHVVATFPEVSIKGKLFEKVMTRVWYTDKKTVLVWGIMKY